MSQVFSTLSKGRQITVPAAVIKRLGLEASDQIAFNIDTTPITITRAETPEEQINRVFHELDEMRKEHEKHLTPEQKQFNKMTAGWTVNQYHQYFDNLPETKAYIKEKYGL